MRVAIVNDSQRARDALRRLLIAHREFRLAWSAADGAEAVRRCAEEPPDLILMDLFMPQMDGVAATREIMQANPCAILVVTESAKAKPGVVFEAMGAGALDAVDVPDFGQMDEAQKANLLRKIRMVALLVGSDKLSRTPPPPAYEPLLLVLGASTGGPAALAQVLAALPHDLEAAVLLAQHVDEQFLDSFARWLDDQVPLPVRLAKAGDLPRPGSVLLAGAGGHLVLTAGGTLAYSEEPRNVPYRPSVNALFESVAAHWHGRGIGVLLTGMGWDGAAGLLALRRGNFYTIAQDQASCAVYGMPKKAVELDAVDEVLPLAEIGPALRARIARDSRRALTG